MIIGAGIAVRLVPLSFTNSLVGADGYWHLVLVKQTLETGFLNFWHPLSHGGVSINYPPGMHALAASLQLLTGLQPEIIAMIFSFPFYLVLSIYAYKKGGLIALAALVFCPVFVWKTLTNFLVDPLWAFLLAICFEKSLVSLVAIFALACVHPISLLAIPFLGLTDERSKLWLYGLAFLIAAFWMLGAQREVPFELQSFLFEGLDPIELVKRAGVPLTGFLVGPQVLSWIVFLLLLVTLKFVELDRAIMASVVLLNKFPKHWIITALVMLQPILAVYMMQYMRWAYPVSWMEPMKWLAENSRSTVAGPYWLGYWIEGIAGRKNILDGNWETSGNQKRMNDLNVILYGEKINADGLLDKYQAKFIVNRIRSGYENVYKSRDAFISG